MTIQKRITTEKFDAFPDERRMAYISLAIQFIRELGWEWSEDNRTELIYITAVYLWQASLLIAQKTPDFPYYTVHELETDWRFLSKNYRIAYEAFKGALNEGKRAALFHWKAKGDCRQLGASEDYPYTIDFKGL